MTPAKAIRYVSNGVQDIESVQMKISVISASRAHLDRIRLILQGGEVPRAVSMVEGGLEQLSVIADQDQPDLIIVDGLCQSVEQMAVLERLTSRHPRMIFVLVCEKVSQDLLIGAMHIGVRDILQTPLMPEALLDAVARIEQKIAAAASPREKGRVISFVPCKGGSGATFLATNLGYILAAEQGKTVALFDLNLQFGDAILFVWDRLPATTIADVAKHVARLDASFLSSSMVHLLQNFSVLAAPESPESAMDVHPEHIEAIVNLAATEYDYVILDIGRNLGATSVRALDFTDMIFPVLQETLPFVRDAKRLLGTLDSLGYPKDRIHPVVNRYEKGGDILIGDVESILGLKVFTTVPNSFKVVSASVNQGVPIYRIAANDPVTKALRQLAHMLTDSSSPKSAGWLSNLLHHA